MLLIIKTSTLGLLLLAKQKGLISLAKPSIDRLIGAGLTIYATGKKWENNSKHGGSTLNQTSMSVSKLKQAQTSYKKVALASLCFEPGV